MQIEERRHSSSCVSFMVYNCTADDAFHCLLNIYYISVPIIYYTFFPNKKKLKANIQVNTE